MEIGLVLLKRWMEDGWGFENGDVEDLARRKGSLNI